ncbi:delta and Notch-like epidermal growth factor-related receptor [Pelobates cultripes]|uniref:Delta and Notch-like epidermal growth factor-related receptor n=1 Tax=Pelobates cultripes TaxID=61616 RepID=A0AAD1RCM7_PELCU|nr:delta and Notch-like epidermal growth factor-related receptor [Pelobates cultripes]
MPPPGSPGPVSGYFLLLILPAVLSAELPGEPCRTEPCASSGSQFVVDPCGESPCNHGNCIVHGDSYLCICNDGFTGVHCSIAPLNSTKGPTVGQPEPDQPTTVPHSQPSLLLPRWRPRAGQKLTTFAWDKVQVLPDVACGNASSNTSNGGRLVSFEVAENTSMKIFSEVTAMLALQQQCRASRFRHCPLKANKRFQFFQHLLTLILSPEQTVVLSPVCLFCVCYAKEQLIHQALQKIIHGLSCRLPNLLILRACVGEGGGPHPPLRGGPHPPRRGGPHPPLRDMPLLASERGYILQGGSCTPTICYGDFGAYALDPACHLTTPHKLGQAPTLSSAIYIDKRRQGDSDSCLKLTGYTGDLCESLLDHCSPQPCRNGATCVTSLNGFSCQCPEGFLGSFCEEKIDPCSSSPCLNNGSCSSSGLSYSCRCSPGYTGQTCAQLVDFCALSPCAHGICRSVGTSYKCLCIPGYHGLYCEEEYNECLSAPCQNGASCTDLVNGYRCVCPPEYEGRHCELYKDPCVNVTCQNGGTCDSEGLNATCTCVSGFMGEECDIDINECESNPCHHSGTCVDQPNGYTCHCPHGWVGANCEIHLQWKAGHMAESLTNMPRHSLYIIIGALCVAFVLMLIILIVGICRISRIEYQGSSRPAYEEFYNCRSIDSEFSSAIASIRHARFGKKSRPAMYDATPVTYEDYSPDDKPLVTLIKTKDL